MPLTRREKLRLTRAQLGGVVFCAAFAVYEAALGWWWLTALFVLIGATFVWLAAAKIHRAERERKIDTWWALVDRDCSAGG